MRGEMMKCVNQFPDPFVQFAKPKVALKVNGHFNAFANLSLVLSDRIFNLKLINESLQLNKNNPELTA